MKHIRFISITPDIAQTGSTSPLEVIVELLLAVFFRQWDNFQVVIQNLQKFYAKTPD